MIGGSFYCSRWFPVYLQKNKKRKKACYARVLTYCATRPLPYHLYADECELLVLTALVTSDSLSKNKFFDRLDYAGANAPA